MAASIGKSRLYMRTMIAQNVGSKLMQSLSCITASALPTTAVMQVRYRNKKARVKDAKEQGVDKKPKIMSKKQRKQALSLQMLQNEKRTILADAPIDNVWIRKFYPPSRLPIEETIERHKALAQPSMLDNMSGLIFLDMRLDYTTKKKTKFINTVKSTLRLPHEFPYGNPPNILVFCKTQENMNLATELGAKHSGTPEEVMNMINNGVINPQNFEHVLCTADCVNDILPARPLFRDRFPQKAKGSISHDLQAMWDLFYYGYTYESQKITDALGRLQVPLGLIEQPTPDLVDNFKAYIDNISKHKSIAFGPFIKSILVVAPPSPEEFLVKVEDYVPGYKNEEIDSDEEDEAEAV